MLWKQQLNSLGVILLYVSEDLLQGVFAKDDCQTTTLRVWRWFITFNLIQNQLQQGIPKYITLYHPLYIQYTLGYTSVITSFDPVLYILLNSFIYFNSFKHLIRFAMTVRVKLSCGLRCLESSGVYDREILPWDCFHKTALSSLCFLDC